MNLEQSPSVVAYCGDRMPCLIRRGTYFCDEKERWLFPMEKLGIHLVPTREQYCRAMGLAWPFFKALSVTGCSQCTQTGFVTFCHCAMCETLPSDAKIAELAGNGMVISVAARLPWFTSFNSRNFAMFFC